MATAESNYPATPKPEYSSAAEAQENHLWNNILKITGVNKKVTKKFLKEIEKTQAPGTSHPKSVWYIKAWADGKTSTSLMQFCLGRCYLPPDPWGLLSSLHFYCYEETILIKKKKTFYWGEKS